MPNASSCPSESVFAELAAGALAVDDRLALETHLDQCPACRELLGILGALPSLDSEKPLPTPIKGTSGSQRRLPWWLTDRAAIAATMLATQCFWSVVLGIPAARWLYVAAESSALPGLTAVYAATLALLGPLLGGAALITSRWHNRWSTRITAIHAFAALPSLVMAPLAIVALVHLRSSAPERRTEP